MLWFQKKKWPHRQVGDRHRDAGEWNAASVAYRLHLETRTSDAGIWVQLGHVEKEGRNFAEAEAAYLQASRLAPANTDALLHLGHMLKGLNRFDEAFAIFAEIARMSPRSEVLEQLRELKPSSSEATAAITAKPGAILFPIQDFVEAFASNTTMTGIQRVQAGITLSLMDRTDADIHFVLDGGAAGADISLMRVDSDDLCDVITYVLGPNVERETLDSKLTLVRINAQPITCVAGNTIVILGAFWGLGEQPARFLKMKRAGVGLAAYIHDVIPITHPQFCDPPFTNAFWRSLADLLLVADFLFTNSHFTRSELLRLIDEYGGQAIPTRVVPLAHALADIPSSFEASGTKSRWHPKRPYVAYVSTVEGRKNHIYVVHAWQKMMATGVKVPDLVFVGRLGWNIAELKTLLRNTANLRGRVHLLQDLSDAELNDVYQGATFTVFTSMVEGWGLPIGESLTQGVPCIASGTASMPEVGGDFVDYVDPEDVENGVRVFTRMIEDENYRNDHRRQIADHFVARRWTDVTDDLLNKISAMSTEYPVRPAPPPVLFPEGDLVRPGDLMGKAMPPQGYFAQPTGLTFAPCFYEPEQGGAWMRGNAGEINFSVALADTDRVVVLMTIRPASHALGEMFCLDTIDVNGPATQPRWVRLAEGENFFRIECPVVDGTVTLVLKCSHDAFLIPGDFRRFLIGLSAIGYAAVGNVSGRADLRRSFLTDLSGVIA